MTILVSGGCGFIGSNFIKQWILNSNEKIINIDKLTYASNLQISKIKNKNYFFYKSDIKNKKKISEILNKHNPRIIINFAAETHVDNSIKNPNIFFNNNVFSLLLFLQTIMKHYKNKKYKFIQISTDEVFGSLTKLQKSFTELSQFKPNNPYSASKAAGDHLVRSFVKTYKFPGIITNCSNNFGPYQNKEKLIPLIITKIKNNKDIPIYGNGRQIRDWLYVNDHCNAINLISENAKIGETYNIGGKNEIENIKLVKIILKIYSEINKSVRYKNLLKLISFVEDRKGHDIRYSIDSSKIRKDLNWNINTKFHDSLKETINWYLNQ
jgi:dTDP-glucose 4,6-dehydratase